MTYRPVIEVATPPGGWGVPWPNVAAAAFALEGLGYSLATSLDPLEKTAHRFTRGDAKVDLVTSAPDVVDVLVADHAAPRVTQKLRGHVMVAIEGGTQALRRTVNARLVIGPERATTVSVPGVFGAIVLKAAAYQADSRDPDRHLQDAAVLLCCLADPYAGREHFAGSDKQRLQTLVRNLPDQARAWQAIPAEQRRNGQSALRILAA
ncbi:hypothetical protein [Promicromonospora soli]|uniref:Uncharacterized protein n=1 Tax=Promicromonospora soli TaxID=2035533 RepID=A0A919FY67_9MICO|nr:hypothetical protein [Promicromonospora soli]GHH74633.1 hypothetical protein GCM10017772_28810 [Promicromonospora soli]